MCSTLLFLWHEAHERLQSQFYHLSHLGIEVGDVVDFVSQIVSEFVDMTQLLYTPLIMGYFGNNYKIQD